MGDGKYDDDDLARLAALVSEQIISQFRTAFESIDEIKLQVSKIPAIQDDVAELKSHMKAVKQAVKDTNADLQELDRRVGELEASAYHA